MFGHFPKKKINVYKNKNKQLEIDKNYHIHLQGDTYLFNILKFPLQIINILQSIYYSNCLNKYELHLKEIFASHIKKAKCEADDLSICDIFYFLGV